MKRRLEAKTLWARLLSAISLGGTAAAAMWVVGQLQSFYQNPWVMGGAGLVAALLGGLLLARPRLAWRSLFCSLAALLLLYGFYTLMVVPQRGLLSFTAYEHDVELQTSYWFGLVCILPFFWLIDGASLTDFPRWQRVFSTVWRSLLVVAIALALGRAHVVSTQDNVCTVVLVDVSDSIPDKAIERSREYLAQVIEAKRSKDLVRLVRFASQAERIDLSDELLALRGDELRKVLPNVARFPKGKTAEESAGAGTDIQGALRLAYGLFPPAYLKRAVVISDGNQTSGDFLAEAYEANSLGVKVYTQTFPDAFPDEVLLQAVSVPEHVQQGAPFDVKVGVYASAAQKASLQLCKDGFCDPADVQSVELVQGLNEVVFPRQKITNGSFGKFDITLRPQGKDTLTDNNKASEVALVKSKPNVLYLEGDRAYSGYLREALASQDIDVEVRGPNEVPTSLSELQAFDMVILSDVDATFVSASQMQLLEQYVRTVGGALLMAGGDRSFGLGGYYRTPIEKILPVDFDTDRERDMPSVAISLVIDKSGSMAGQKIELVKEASKAVVDLLAPSDKISVIGFDSNPLSVVQIQPARNRMKILSDISRLEAGGGTAIFPALDMAFGELMGVKAKIKHVILLSDGQAPTEGLTALASAMFAEKITLSTVGVGENLDYDLLRQMADGGGGRSYFTRDATSIPKIFTKETSTATRSAVVEGAFSAIPTPKGQSAQALRGIEWSVAPPLLGYVATKAKTGAEVLLVSDYGEPLLARMNVGLGKTAVFTSDVKNRWSSEWIRWSGYGTFWSQVVRDLMRRRVQEKFELQVEVQGDSFHAVVDAVGDSEEFVNGLQSVLRVYAPDKPSEKREFPLYQTAAGRYEGDFRLPGFGAYVVEATHSLDGNVLGQSRATVSKPYPREYLSFDREGALLAQGATLTGGKASPTPTEALSAAGEQMKEQRPLWPYAVLAALVLFLLDIFFRRVRLGRV